MRVKARKADLGAAAAQHHAQAGVGEPTLLPEWERSCPIDRKTATAP
jgi:hypothetical protein